MSRYTREWLERTPPDQAAEALARIAERAQAEPHSLVNQFVGMLTAAFATSPNLEGGRVARRVGTRAALALASLDDARSIPPLVRVFEPKPLWQGKYQELVEKALAALLSQLVGRPKLHPYADDLRKLVQRIWNTGRPAQNLSEGVVEVLIAALRCLHALGEPSDLTLLQSIAAGAETNPGRRRVQEAVQALLNR